MRRVGVAIVLLALVSCGTRPAGAPRTTPAPSYADDAERVKAALAATREKGTGAYVVEATRAFPGVAATVRREGVYDLLNGRARYTESLATDPPEKFQDVWGPRTPEESRHDEVRADGKAYVEIDGKWYAAERNNIANARRHDALDLAGMPIGVAVLEDARPASRRGSGDTAYVTIPAGSAYIAFPTLVVRKAMVSFDPEKLDGDVEVEVTIVGGVVTALTFEHGPTFRKAMDAGGFGRGFAGEGARLRLTLSRHGEPVTVDVPTDVES